MKQILFFIGFLIFYSRFNFVKSECVDRDPAALDFCSDITYERIWLFDNTTTIANMDALAADEKRKADSARATQWRGPVHEHCNERLQEFYCALRLPQCNEAEDGPAKICEEICLNVDQQCMHLANVYCDGEAQSEPFGPPPNCFVVGVPIPPSSPTVPIILGSIVGIGLIGGGLFFADKKGLIDLQSLKKKNSSKSGEKETIL